MSSNPSLQLLALLLIFSCTSQPVHPLETLREVDALLKSLTPPPQQLTTVSDRPTTVKGAKGTLIHIDPDNLETTDGTPMGDTITATLIDLTTPSDLMLYQAPTVSDGLLLVSGGAYFLNLTTDGTPLQLKTNRALAVEFPRYSRQKMDLFTGQRDSMGQLNWTPTSQKFQPKNLIKPQQPAPQTNNTRRDDIEDILSYINPEAPKLTEAQKKAYETQIQQYYMARKTYQAVELSQLGWINCDRFYNNPAPKTTLHLLVNNDSITSARAYAIFKDFNGMMTTHYSRAYPDTMSFEGLPVGQSLQVVALSAKGKTALMFEQEIQLQPYQMIKLDFKPKDQTAIKAFFQTLN